MHNPRAFFFVCAALLGLALLLPRPAAANWPTSLVNVPLCTATDHQLRPTSVSNGAGGAIVTWEDYRSGNVDIYAQRISAAGTVQWAANGVALCTATGSQQSTGIAADDAGGAIVTWTDSRSGSTSDIYAQRISAEGTPQWMADGATLCAATGAQQSPAIVADGEGGAIVAWYGSGINAQRISAAGAVQWAANGVAVCATAGYNPTIAADGEGGANVVWADTRGGSSVIYAQRVSAGGAVQWTTDGVALGPAPTTAVVPDDFPTIQAGIDSGRDTVLVRSGRYDEDLVLVAGVTLAAIPSGAGTDTVVTGGLSITQPTDGRPWPDRTLIDVRGIHFAGRVRAEPAPRQYAYQIAFAACRMDSSLSLNALFVEHVSVDHCTILNGSSISTTGGSASLTHNTVLGGGIYVHNDGGEYTIRGNYVHGPAGYGIRAFMDSGGLLDSNTVIGVGVGVYVWGGSAWVHDNTVMECSGSGIVSSWDGNRIEGNLVQNCGGFGIDATSSRVALVGPNTILACQTGGIRLQAGYGWLVGNVVGRCGGPGMEGGGQVERNTCYLNSGPGFKIATANTSITNNIAFSNSGPGLQWTGSDAPTLACNDWFGNTGGATVGTLPGPTDSSMAPLFCDFTMDDVHLSAGSALLDASGCGLIGALGRGCSVPVGESLVRALTASPNPSRGSVRFSWPISPRPDRLEVLDVTGARRWSAPIAGWICTLRWPGVDRDGTRLAAGVYYARLMGNGASATARFVLVQ